MTRHGQLFAMSNAADLYGGHPGLSRVVLSYGFIAAYGPVRLETPCRGLNYMSDFLSLRISF